MSETQSTDIAIIGAGPVGLFAVFEAGMLEMRCHVVDALDAPGGQCTALYPEKPIYDIPGHPEIDGGALVEALLAQAAPFSPVYHLGHRIERLKPLDGGGWRLESDKGLALEARAVIVAAGGGAFGPNRPPLARIEAYEGTAVFYAIARREDFRDKHLVIGGGGDSAVDWAISLAEVAKSVRIVHRRAKFRAAPESVARLQALADAGRIELVVPYQLAGLEGAEGRLSAVVVRTLDGEERRLPADVLLPFYGLSTELGPIAEWGLETERSLVCVDPARFATSAPDIFAIGDIVTYPGKLKLILCGFSEAAMAAQAIHPLVHPGEALHFEYSTTKGLPE
jgi:thioredoxin reductase (NADPH)